MSELTLAVNRFALGAAIGAEFYVSRDALVEAVRAGGAFNVIPMATAVKVDIFVALKLGVSDLLERALSAPGV